MNPGNTGNGHRLAPAILAAAVFISTRLHALDCNRNSIEDAAEIASGASPDCNRNGVPDECEVLPGIDFSSRDSSDFTEYPLKPRDIAALLAADLDGDGDLDLATANFKGRSVSVLLNEGGGRFRFPRDYPAGNAPSSLRAFDVDGDGDLDLAAADAQGDGLLVLRNRGNGEFEDPVKQSTAGWDPVAFEVGDLDGDRDLDLALAIRSPVNDGTLRRRETALLALINPGDGALQEGARILLDGENPTSLAIADLDGDSDPDLAYSHLGGVSARFNAGDGTFSAALEISRTGPVFEARALDLDADGAADLAALVDFSWKWFRNRGDGSFEDPRDLPVAPGARGWLPADLDGDRDLDLAYIGQGEDGEPSFVVLRSQGGGSFSPPVEHPGAALGFLALGDFDGDGDVDGAVAFQDGVAQALFRNLGDGSFAAVEVAVLGTGVADVIAADLTGDGAPDLVSVNPDTGDLTLLRNIGYGFFDSPDRSSIDDPPFEGFIGAGDGPVSAAAGDLDGDGDLDLAAANRAGGDLSVILNRGGGMFGPALSVPAGGAPVRVIAADLDGDEDLDLAAAIEAPAGVSVFFNRGGADFAPPLPLPLAAGFAPLALTGADIDGDRDIDLILAGGASGTIALLRNRGDGSFSAAESIDAGGEPSGAAAADLDSDGDLDLVVSGRGTGTLSVLLNLGGGSFPAPQPIDAGGLRPISLALADIDGDGRIDAVAVGEGSGAAFIFTGNGDGTFDRPLVFEAGTAPAAIAAGDGDGDGDPDLYVAHRGDSAGMITALRNALLPPVRPDCDRNGIPDECDLAADPSLDSDRNGLFDACETFFRRGDANSDGLLSISDAVNIRRYQFNGGKAPTCLDAADVDDNGLLQISDWIWLLHALFVDPAWSTVIPEPYPLPGGDPTADEIPCAGYEVVPAQRSADVLRLGEAEAVPGGQAEIPVYLTNLVSVDAIQLVVEYDPDFFVPSEIVYRGTFYEQNSDPEFGAPCLGESGSPDFSELTLHPDHGVFTAAIAARAAVGGCEIPPAEEILVAWIRGTVPGGAPGGVAVKLAPTNGEGDAGVGPFHLHNELTHDGEARFVTFFPETVPGELRIINPDFLDFLRADSNGDFTIDISDAVFTLSELFLGGEPTRCPDAQDANDDGQIDISDPIVTLGWLFGGGIGPGFPALGACAPDRTPDLLGPCFHMSCLRR